MESMLYLDTVLERARAINVSPSALARMARVSRSTIHRGARITALSLRRLNDALFSEEERLLRHLDAVGRRGNGGSGSA